MKGNHITKSIIITAIFTLNLGCASIHTAAYKGNYQEVKKKIEAKEDINGKDRYGWTPLHYAVYYNYYSIIKLLLKKGADPNIQSIRPYGSILAKSTPLIIAAYYGNFSAVKLLLGHGAKRDIINSGGYTAIDYAEKFNFGRISEVLSGATRPVEQEKILPSSQSD